MGIGKVLLHCSNLTSPSKSMFPVLQHVDATSNGFVVFVCLQGRSTSNGVNGFVGGADIFLSVARCAPGTGALTSDGTDYVSDRWSGKGTSAVEPNWFSKKAVCQIAKVISVQQIKPHFIEPYTAIVKSADISSCYVVCVSSAIDCIGSTNGS